MYQMGPEMQLFTPLCCSDFVTAHESLKGAWWIAGHWLKVFSYSVPKKRIPSGSTVSG